MTLPSHFASPCGICRKPACEHAVAQEAETGRWFITIGHPGFNTRANNLNGYASRAQAYAAYRRHNGASYDALVRRIGPE
jgi:hypothetical protein